MSAEEQLANTVAEWAKAETPGEQDGAEYAVAVALGYYRCGGSVSEAHEAAMAYLDSWRRHPAHRRTDAETGSSLEMAS